MKYTILPLDTKDQDVLRDHKLFESWDILDKTSGFNISQYKKVYEGEVEDQGGDLKTLDHLFGVFNIHHPQGLQRSFPLRLRCGQTGRDGLLL